MCFWRSSAARSTYCLVLICLGGLGPDAALAIGISIVARDDAGPLIPVLSGQPNAGTASVATGGRDEVLHGHHVLRRPQLRR